MHCIVSGYLSPALCCFLPDHPDQSLLPLYSDPEATDREQPTLENGCAFSEGDLGP